MQNPVVRGFANLMRFGGRDTRAQFWPYAAVAVALYLVAGWALLIPVVFPIFATSSEPSIAEFQDMIGRFLAVCMLMFVALVALLAAAVARRLHDSGRTALWGLLPLPFVAYSGTMFFRLSRDFVSGMPDERVFFSVFASNVLYFLGVGVLVALLARRSRPGSNRYG